MRLASPCRVTLGLSSRAAGVARAGRTRFDFWGGRDHGNERTLRRHCARPSRGAELVSSAYPMRTLRPQSQTFGVIRRKDLTGRIDPGNEKVARQLRTSCLATVATISKRARREPSSHHRASTLTRPCAAGKAERIENPPRRRLVGASAVLELRPQHARGLQFLRSGAAQSVHQIR
jgi:hypothetical protein